MPPRIEGLFWPPGSEDHVEEHIDAWTIDELVEGRDFYVFSNKEGHPPHRWRVIGRVSGVGFITAILEEPNPDEPTLWRVITGWPSEPFERAMYEQEKKRIGKKQGR